MFLSVGIYLSHFQHTCVLVLTFHYVVHTVTVKVYYHYTLCLGTCSRNVIEKLIS